MFKFSLGQNSFGSMLSAFSSQLSALASQVSVLVNIMYGGDAQPSDGDRLATQSPAFSHMYVLVCSWVYIYALKPNFTVTRLRFFVLQAIQLLSEQPVI